MPAIAPAASCRCTRRPTRVCSGPDDAAIMCPRMIGRRLSHYEIIEEISRGGMGGDYRARDVNLGREVALKVLPEERLHDPGRRDPLLQDARAASALEQPHRS